MKQLTNHLNLRKLCLDWTWHILLHSEFGVETLILLKDISSQNIMINCIDVNVHDRHILLVYEKCHCQELLPFVRVWQYS